ncbi:unnamed protein product [Urochloa decumbens]|uniref:Uncharacterized protein n=1 Tax=Urochloa decumbens TaxID=240449 RepID=A0ABC9BYR2_9POAL
MHLAYLLLFLLHLSAASTCGATSRNQHLFLHGAVADVSATSPAIHGHRHAAKVLIDFARCNLCMQDLSYYHVHYHPAMMLARRGGPPPRPSPSVEMSGGGGGGVEGAPPPPSLPGVEASGVVAGGAPPPPEKESGAAVEPSPSPSPPREVDDGGGEHEENATDDVGVDYAGPKTHPPSHN